MRSTPVFVASSALLLSSLLFSADSVFAHDASSGAHHHKQRLERHPIRHRHHPTRDNASDQVKRDTTTVASDSLKLGFYHQKEIYAGHNFFDGWTFFNYSDPTHGVVTYVTQETATAEGLAYVDANNKVIMKVDSTSDLPYGAHRNSVRISSNNAYNNGLFVLDAAKFPYGCSVWPAWWMVGPDWPNHGEIDIFEGVNLNNKNQYTAHTAAGCSIDTDPTPKFTVPSSSATLGLTDCGPSPSNSGCDYLDTNTDSFGAGLNQCGGAVLALQWESDGLKIWNFPRGEVPLDLEAGIPIPELWGGKHLKGAWANTTCSTQQYFNNMSMVFDITLCGDWAGASSVYGSSGCPGNCTTQVMTGSNFVDASWEINYVAVYGRD